MALAKALDQDVYLARNVYGENTATGDVEDVLTHLADPEDPLYLRLSTEDRVRTVLHTAVRRGGPAPMATELMAVRDAAVGRFADPAEVPPACRPRTAAEADEIVAAVVEECAARGLEAKGPGASRVASGGVVRLSPLDPAFRDTEVALCHAGVEAVYFVPALVGGRFGPRAFREGAFTFEFEDAGAVAGARGADGAERARQEKGRKGRFFALVGPMDECGIARLARFCDKKTWSALRQRVCGTRTFFGDYRGGTTGRHGRFATFSKGDLFRFSSKVRREAAEALGAEPDQDKLASLLAAGLARTRHSVEVGLACLEEFDRAGGDVCVTDALDAEGASSSDFLRVEAKVGLDGGDCTCRCAATGYGAPRSAPTALRDAMDRADRAGSVVRLYDGSSVWSVVQEASGASKGREGRANAYSADVDALDGRSCVRMWLGATAYARDRAGNVVPGPDGRPVSAAATDPASLRARGIGADQAANLAGANTSVPLRPAAVPGAMVRVVARPASKSADSMRVVSPGAGRTRSVENVERDVARRELSWMVEEAVASMVDRAAPARMLACVRAGADPADFTFDEDRQVAAFQRAMLDYLTGRTDDPPVDDGELFEATVAERGRSCAKVAEAWARQVCGRVTEDSAHICPGRVADFAPAFDGRITSSLKVDALMRQAEIAPEEVFGAEGTFERDLDAMVAFDPETAKDVGALGDDRPMARAAGAQVLASLRALGVADVRCAVDARGVMRYEGTAQGKNTAPVVGYLGQVFEADGDGVVTTAFLGRDDHCFVPAMRGRFGDRGKAFAEPWNRMEIEGVERRLRRAVATRVAAQVMAATDGRRGASQGKNAREAAIPPVHGETALNRAWRAIEEGQERWPTDFRADLAAHGHDVAALIARARRLVRFPKRLGEQAGADAFVAHEDLAGSDGLSDTARCAFTADRTGDGFDLTGHTCIRQVGYDHLFDPLDVVYTGDSQGIARVLGEGVTLDGRHPVPAKEAEVFGPLTAKGVHRHTREHCAADRAGMTLSNNRHSVWADQPATVAQMSLGGLTMEDAFVVSAAWAAAHPVPAKGGGTRPLMPGDKLCDKAGNKGVISFIADPAAPTDDLGPAKAAAVRLFAANPHLDMVVSGFSNLSRLNAGTLLEMMENGHDLKIPATVRALPEVALPEPRAADGTEALDGPAAEASLDALFDGPAAVVRLPFDVDGSPALVEVGAQVTGGRRQAARSCLADAMEAALADAQAASPTANAVKRVLKNGERDRFHGSCRKKLAAAARAGAALGPAESPARTVAGGCGTIRVDVPDKLADKKTNVYDRRRGEGRKASAQLLSVLTQEGCDALVGELYGRQTSFERIRQRCAAFGVSIDGAGNVAVMESADQIPGQRIELPAPSVRIGRPAAGAGAAVYRGGETKVPELDTRACREAVARLLQGPAGYVVLPFPVDLGRHLSGERHVAPVADGGGWCLPVVGTEARRATLGPDGRERESDVTRSYSAILTAAVRQRFYAQAADSFAAMGDTARADKCRAKAERSESDCRHRVRTLAAKLEAEVCCDKDNEFVGGLMKARLPGTSTAVWHPDPDLSVDQVALSAEVAANAGVKEGDRVLILRDPILRSGGLRYLEVVVDDAIAGIAVNPVIAQSFDGDFDGDTIGVIPVTDPAARAEAARSFSCASHGVRVDRGAAPDTDGTKPLYYNCGSDVRLGCARADGLTEALEADRALANAGDPSFLESFDGHVAEALAASIYQGHIVVESPQTMAESLYGECVETGVKGDVGKLAEFLDYAGYRLEPGSDGRLFSVVAGGSCRDREKTLGSQLATAIKTEDTGKAGALTKSAVSVCRGGDVVAATECTYGVTQGLLKAKQNPVDAMMRHRLVGKRVRDAFRGLKEEGGRADPAEYAENLKEVMGEHGFGLSLDPALIDSLAAQVAVENPAGSRKTTCDMTSKDYGDFIGASPLDFVAYHFGPDSLRQVAEAGGANLYDGLEAAAPATVRRRREEQGRGAWTAEDARALFEEHHTRPVEPEHPTFLSGALGRAAPARSRQADDSLEI